MTTILIISSVILILICWILYVFKQKPSENDESAPSVTGTKNGSTSQKAGKKGEKDAGSKASKRNRKDSTKTESSSTEADFAHPWLMATLKAHTADVQSIQLSPNGHLLASAAPDRTVLLWTTKDFQDRNHKQVRVNIPLDSATKVSWSPDNKAFLIARADDLVLEVFKLGKKPDGSLGNIQSAITFPKVHQVEIVGIGIACNGKYIMSCSQDGLMVLWDIKGNIFAQMSVGDTKSCCMAKVSPCSRYVAACGENGGSTLTVHEVKFNSSGNYDDTAVAFKLSGHKAGVYAFDFNTDSSKIVTLDTSFCWRLYDTTGNHVDIVRSGTLSTSWNGESKPVISLSTDCRIIIAGINENLELYSARTASQICKIEKVHKDPVKEIVFSTKDDYFITCGDRIIRVFNNVCGIKEKREDLAQQIKDPSLSQGLRNRLTSELKSLESQSKD